MHGVVLVKGLLVANLPHVDHDGANTTEERVAGSLVCLPAINEMVDSLLEDLAIDGDVGHAGDSNSDSTAAL